MAVESHYQNRQILCAQHQFFAKQTPACNSFFGSGCKIIMSKDNIKVVKEADVVSCCACCGITEIDNIKLKDCDGCDLVRYCGDECREEHKSEHEEYCKKRAAELRDEILFKHPESCCYGDCPICSLPLPIGEFQSTMYSCCSKLICNGCDYARGK